MSDNGLADYSPQALYDFLDHLAEQRRRDGQGRSPDAYQCRQYCSTMRKKVGAELRRRGLPPVRPGDERVYGPGQAHWQGANVEAA